MENKNPVWHPYTQEKLYPSPLKVKSAKGSVLTLEDGRELIDGISSWWVNLFGHGREEIAEAIYRQGLNLEHVIFAGFTHEPAISLANDLLKVCNNHFHKVFYSDNGSTAVEVAIKMALQYHHNKGDVHKRKIIALEGAYHGDTFGAMSVGEKSAFNAPFQSYLFDVLRLPLPNATNMSEIEQMLDDCLDSGEIAGFIYEPLVLGTAGMKFYDAEMLDQLLTRLKSHGVLLIADEVMTGFGRTGEIFASDYLKCKPDLMCLSKGITGGFMPLGVTMAVEKIYEAFYSDERSKTFFHGHSYTGNPLSCGAARVSLNLLQSDDIVVERKRLSTKLSEMTAELVEMDNAINVRQLGCIAAFEVKTDEESGYFNSSRDRFYNMALKNGVLLRPLGNTIYTMPPYTTSNSELDKIQDTFKLILKYKK